VPETSLGGPRRQTPGRTVRVLDVDPELGEGLDSSRFERARLSSLARVHQLPVGEWRDTEWPDDESTGFGLLLLDGLLVRQVTIAGREAAELLSAGDLLRPWQSDDETASIVRHSAWRVLDRAHLAVLDERFAQRACAYPEITTRLMGRILRRARRFAVLMAIVHQPRVDRRVVMLLWHLADRFGRVTPDGVVVPLRLTHDILAELLAARRPTVSAALASLEREGLLAHNDEGWLLYGSPPGEMESAVNTM
jgi:CRP-like cAMP-binding protein